jgi:hypothetical protein
MTSAYILFIIVLDYFTAFIKAWQEKDQLNAGLFEAC